MLANMQESMRGYFDELSRQKSFLGIQEVLVKEINNSDSKKYAILTTTDSFYPVSYTHLDVYKRQAQYFRGKSDRWIPLMEKYR